MSATTSTVPTTVSTAPTTATPKRMDRRVGEEVPSDVVVRRSQARAALRTPRNALPMSLMIPKGSPAA
jgi:hypothetical protein